MAVAEPELHDLLENRDLDAASNWLNARSSVSVAEELGRVEGPDQAIAFRLLPKDRALDVFEYLDPVHQAELLEALRDDHVRDIFESLAPDDQASLLDEMPAKVASRLLQGLPYRQRKVISGLLGYPSRSAGRLMVPTATVLSPEMSREESLEKLQSRAQRYYANPHHVSTLATVAVTDDSRKLVGMLNLSDLVTAPEGTLVSDLLDDDLHSVTAYEDQEVAARLMQEADLLALPVVDDEDRILGVITVDDAMEVLEVEVTEDAYRAGGAEPLNEPYLTATVMTLAKKRGVWLIVLILAAFLTINVMQYFEDTLEAVVVLSIFVPMLIGTGGNAGSQAASSVVRALAVNEVRPSDIMRVIWREIRVGFLLGVFLGAVTFPILSLLYYPKVAVTVGLTIVAICSWSCIVGGVLPLVAKKIGVDPAVFSTPVVATLVDATGLIIYFSIAGFIMADQIRQASGH